MQWRLTRDWANDAHVSGAKWIRRVYPEPERRREIREHGHDCIQRPGDLMLMPRRWIHMVVNIDDTVSVVSEVGLGIGEGKKPEEFQYDPGLSRDDDSEDWSEDWSEDDDSEGGGRKGSCSVCSGGLTVHNGTIIPHEEAEGASCGEMMEESSRVCSEMKQVEEVCCPSAGMSGIGEGKKSEDSLYDSEASSDNDSKDWSEDGNGEDRDQGGSCSVCSGGLTVHHRTIIPHDEAEGCGEMIEFAPNHSDSSQVCSEMKQAKEVCCPGASMSSRDIEDWNEGGSEDYSEDDSEDDEYENED